MSLPSTMQIKPSTLLTMKIKTQNFGFPENFEDGVVFFKLTNE
jgi:hypothetical protein